MRKTAVATQSQQEVKAQLSHAVEQLKLAAKQLKAATEKINKLNSYPKEKVLDHIRSLVRENPTGHKLHRAVVQAANNQEPFDAIDQSVCRVIISMRDHPPVIAMSKDRRFGSPLAAGAYMIIGDIQEEVKKEYFMGTTVVEKLFQAVKKDMDERHSDTTLSDDYRSELEAEANLELFLMFENLAVSKFEEKVNKVVLGYNKSFTEEIRDLICDRVGISKQNGAEFLEALYHNLFDYISCEGNYRGDWGRMTIEGDRVVILPPNDTKAKLESGIRVQNAD